MAKFEKYRKLPENFFGLLFWNIFSLYAVIFACLGLLALFGIKPIEFNDEPTYGIFGLMVSLLMAPLMALVTSSATWLLVVVGNFILKFLLKLI